MRLPCLCTGGRLSCLWTQPDPNPPAAGDPILSLDGGAPILSLDGGAPILSLDGGAHILSLAPVGGERALPAAVVAVLSALPAEAVAVTFPPLLPFLPGRA